MYRIDEHTKHRIVALKEEGASIQDISDELGVTRKTVKLWIRRWEEEGRLNTHVSNGRPRKTSTEQDRLLIEDVQYRRFVTTSTYAIDRGVSIHTIRRRLHTAGIHCRIPAKKPKLTDRHKRLRLNFARRYFNFNFDNVCFVDEKVFTTASDGRLYLWRLNNTRYDERNVIPNRRSGRISFGYWGWMSASGPGELVEISGRMNARNYKEILEDVLVPTATAAFGNEPIFLMQDNSSVHNSHVVQLWIEEQEGLHLIKLPPKSPDLNPIENLWGLMVQAWDPTAVRSVDSLKDHVNFIWNSFIGRDVCFNMVRSMRERLQSVIDNEGGYTRY